MKETVNRSETTIWNRNFICIIITNLMLCIAHFSINPLVASYAVYLGSGALMMGLLTGLFFGVALSMRPVAGPVITKIDKRKLMILVFTLGGFVNLGYALFHNIPAFIVFRFLHGVQYSLVGSLIMTLAGDNLPKAKMASGMGIYGQGGAIGMAIGPTIGISLQNMGAGLRDEGFGYTFVFLFAMIILFLAVIPNLILLPDKKTKEDKLSTGAWYRNIATVHAIPTAVIMFFVIMGWSLINVYIVEFGKEQGIVGISSFYLALAITLILSRPASGWLADRFGYAKIQIPALVLYAAAFIIIGFSRSIGMLLAGAILTAIGFGSSQPALFSMCAQSETPLKRSVASNTLYIGLDLGLFLGPVIGSVIYKFFNYSFMFKSGALIILFALISFILMYPLYKRRRKALEKSE